MAKNVRQFGVVHVVTPIACVLQRDDNDNIISWYSLKFSMLICIFILEFEIGIMIISANKKTTISQRDIALLVSSQLPDIGDTQLGLNNSSRTLQLTQQKLLDN